MNSFSAGTCDAASSMSMAPDILFTINTLPSFVQKDELTIGSISMCQLRPFEGSLSGLERGVNKRQDKVCSCSSHPVLKG